MRWALLGLALAIVGTTRAQELSEEDAIKQLAKHGIEVYRREDRCGANVRVANEEAMKALSLLRHVKRVDNLNMEITDAKLVKGSVDALKYAPTLKGMGIYAKNGLPEADLEGIAKLGKLETLSLRANEVTAKQLRLLADLVKQKRLKLLSITTSQFPKEELKVLKDALAEDSFRFTHLPSLCFMEPLPIAPEESRLEKLQKQKLNAAIADIVANLREHQGFIGENNSLDVIRLHNLRSAALDFDDTALRSKIIDDYVFITEKRYRYVKARFDNDERRGADRSNVHLFEYEYAEAQLTQLRLTKKADAKPK